MRELTRGKAYSLLLKENIAYGFHRNMLGVRAWGWVTSTLAIITGLALSGVVRFDPLEVHAAKMLQMPLAAALTLGIAIPLWLSWFHFNEAAVRRIAFAYAERLFECLRAIPTPRRPKSTKTTTLEPGESAEVPAAQSL